MTSTQATVAIIIAVLGVVGTIGGILLRNSRKSPETKDAQTNAWGALNDRMNKHMDWLTSRVTALETDNTAKNDRITALDNRVEGLESEIAVFRVLVLWLRNRVAQLIEHILKTGGTPPDPNSPEPGP